jgi:dihydrophenazinedicarboxylate synthase
VSILEDSIYIAPPHEPIPGLQAWYRHAVANNAIDPGAMALATAGFEGLATNRIIQLLEIRNEGLLFATHSGSPKGRHIAQTGWASGVLYWRETKRQAIISGSVSPVADSESDQLWSNRPPESHAMSTVSQQSAVLDDEGKLLAQAYAARERAPLRRPSGWKGYVLQPVAVEFWEFSPDRLYKRLRYDKVESDWVHQRLQP